MSSRADLIRRVDAARMAPPLTEAAPAALSELEEALEAAETFEDLPGKWQAAVLAAESSAPPPPRSL